VLITVQVGSTSVRPIISDQHFSWVIVEISADLHNPAEMHRAELEAQIIAFEMTTASRKNIEMITSTKIIAMEGY
jgi:hypothetical protein